MASKEVLEAIKRYIDIIWTSLIAIIGGIAEIFRRKNNQINMNTKRSKRNYQALHGERDIHEENGNIKGYDGLIDEVDEIKGDVKEIKEIVKGNK